MAPPPDTDEDELYMILSIHQYEMLFEELVAPHQQLYPASCPIYSLIKQRVNRMEIVALIHAWALKHSELPNMIQTQETLRAAYEVQYHLWHKIQTVLKTFIGEAERQNTFLDQQLLAYCYADTNFFKKYWRSHWMFTQKMKGELYKFTARGLPIEEDRKKGMLAIDDELAILLRGIPDSVNFNESGGVKFTWKAWDAPCEIEDTESILYSSVQ